MKKDRMTKEENQRWFMSEFNPKGIEVTRDGSTVLLSELAQLPPKEIVIDEIQEHIKTTIAELNKENDIPPPATFHFDCSCLADKSLDGFEEFIKKINNSYPTIYWFEINPIIDIKTITDGISLCRKTNTVSVPPTNEKSSNNILYVGKVRKNFKLRINQHLGYGSSKTGSLQLKYWTSGIKLNLTLNYIQFSKGQSDIKLAIYEQCVTEKLNPILGKHSI